jgi:hypothetical protein
MTNIHFGRVLKVIQLLIQKEMKNQSTNNFKANMPDELKFSNSTVPVSKKPGYIYTEEDLGEGILDVGISA